VIGICLRSVFGAEFRFKRRPCSSQNGSKQTSGERCEPVPVGVGDRLRGTAHGESPLRKVFARPEPLSERKVDPLDELDRHRIAKDGIRAARFDGAMVERPQQRLGHVLELDRDPLHARDRSAEARVTVGAR
jgi:hypothetical protein